MDSIILNNTCFGTVLSTCLCTALYSSDQLLSSLPNRFSDHRRRNSFSSKRFKSILSFFIYFSLTCPKLSRDRIENSIKRWWSCWHALVGGSSVIGGSKQSRKDIVSWHRSLTRYIDIQEHSKNLNLTQITSKASVLYSRRVLDGFFKMKINFSFFRKTGKRYSLYRTII